MTDRLGLATYALMDPAERRRLVERVVSMATAKDTELSDDDRAALTYVMNTRAALLAAAQYAWSHFELPAGESERVAKLLLTRAVNQCREIE
jgi:hypothetical protein